MMNILILYKNVGDLRMIYLDHAATTSVCPEAIDEMKKCLEIYYGNPSGAYEFAEQCKEKIEMAREQVAKSINASCEEIYFTSGGTESDNWALFGTVRACRYNGRRGKHIITSCIEHHAVLNSCKALEKQGYKVTYLPVDEDGIISLKQLERSIRNDTILISIMYANNEIGTVQPVNEIAKIAEKYGIYFHTDAVQAYMHIPIDVKKMGIHMMSVSSHKFCGPKGIGFLYVSKDCDVEKFIYGGKQERDMRAGTENVPGIVGMGTAIKVGLKSMYKKNLKTANVRDYFLSRIENEIKDVRINGAKPGKDRLPGNLNVSFKGIEGETLLIILDMNGICASAGSACNTGEPGISHVIESIHVPKEYAGGTIRFTLGDENTIEEIDKVMDVLKNAIEVLRE